LCRYFVSQSSEFCRHNPLCCFSTSNTKGKRVFRYRLSPETFGYTLVQQFSAPVFISLRALIKLAVWNTKWEMRIWNDFQCKNG